LHREDEEFYYGLLLLNKSIYLERLNLLEKSLLCIEELEKHLRITVSLDNEFRTSVVIRMYIMYASILNKLHMNERALDYAKKGIKLAQKNRDYEYLFRLWAQTSIIYESLGDLVNAERYFLKAMNLEPILQGKESLFPFSFVHFTMLLIRKKQWDKAKQLIERSIQICRINNSHFFLTKSLLVYGEWYIHQYQYGQAIPVFLEAEEIAREYRFDELRNESMASLCTCYDDLRDESNFLKYAIKLHRLERGGN
jgi:tetratricopeptide (TPR) repeat protein